MPLERPIARNLGTMIAYGFAGRALNDELALARRIGASVLEILPDWRVLPSPGVLRDRVAGAGLAVHSAHGCWGGQSIEAPRVDLGSLDPATRAASIDDLRRCVDWLAEAGGTCLVVHPGGLSDPEQLLARREALAQALGALADHARGTRVILCVENMPPGVHPGSRMADLAALAAEIDRPEVALALDTGHANIAATADAETLAAAGRLRTTHVHDNDGRQDVHLPPGSGTIDWDHWVESLDQIHYQGPIMLECIRHLRNHPDEITAEFLARLDRLTRGSWSRNTRTRGGDHLERP
jgi:sugar phosphate isomerase/epimerase